jgi:cation diffusion facilitator family transporter
MPAKSVQKKPDKTENLRQGQRIALIATLVTLLLAVVKAAVGYLFDSKVLVADAFHSGADLLAIFASGFGLWVASRKKTEKFPYGLYKFENLVTLIIGALITWAGMEMLTDGYHKLFDIADVKKFPVLPVIVSVFSIIVAFVLARKEKNVGESINSQSLIANASESFLDIFTSLVVLAGILLAYLRISYVEGSIIILISILIFKLGMENIWTSLLVLLDANLDVELQSDIEKDINRIYGVKGVGEVMIRQAGPVKMVECKILTSPSLSLYKAHTLADKVEDHITNNFKHIESVFIHVEPSRENFVSAIVPVQDINGMDSKIHGHFGRAPYFVILKIADENVEIEDFYYNEFLDEKKHVGVKVIKAVVRHKLDLLFTSRIGEISFHMLRDNFVGIYKTEEGLSVKDIINKYRNQQIEQITKPTHCIEESLSSLSKS